MHRQNQRQLRDQIIFFQIINEKDKVGRPRYDTHCSEKHEHESLIPWSLYIISFKTPREYTDVIVM